MITLYGYASSPNVLKVRILLKEAAIPYEERDIHQERDESCSTRFLELSPTGAVPAIEESDTDMLEDFVETPVSHYPQIADWLQRLSDRAAFQEASNVVRWGSSHGTRSN